MRGAFVAPGELRQGYRNRPWLVARVPWSQRPRAVHPDRLPISSSQDLEAQSMIHIRPADSGEAVRWLEDLACVTVVPMSIRPIGWTTPGALLRATQWAQLTIESIVTGLVVDVLDDDGDIIETIEVDGRDPCTSAIVHPQPEVGPLTWRWTLVRRDISGGEVTPVQGAAPLGASLQTWGDSRYGWARTYRTTPQIVVGGYPAAQVYCTIFGPDTNHYRVRVTTGLEGYTQDGGPQGAARRNVEVRN